MTTVRSVPIGYLSWKWAVGGTITQLLFAAIISGLAVLFSVAIEGRVIFHNTLNDMGAVQPCTIVGVSPLGHSDSLVVHFIMATEHPLGGLRGQLCIYEGLSQPPSFRRLPLDVAPFMADVDSQGQAYVSTEDGAIYRTEIKATSPDTVYIGSHELRVGQFIECSGDGMIIVGATNNVTMAWNSSTRALLWRRDDLTLNCGAFAPGTHRFFAGVETGQVLEVDGDMGRTVRELASPSHWTFDLQVSPCGNFLLVMTELSTLTVVDIQSGQVLWSRECTFDASDRAFGGAAAFCPDGRTMVISLTDEQEELAIVSTRTGSVLRSIPQTSKTRGLRVAADGTIYGWNFFGVLTAWDPDNGTIKRRFYPARDWTAFTRKEHRVIHSVLDYLVGTSLTTL